MERHRAPLDQPSEPGEARISPALEREPGLPASRLAQTRWWMPLPKARWWCASSRVGVEAVRGTGKTALSRPLAASQRKSFAPSGRSTPPSVTGLVVTRRRDGHGGCRNRSVSSTAPGMSAGSATITCSATAPRAAAARGLPIRLFVVSWPAKLRREEDGRDLLPIRVGTLRVLVVDGQRRRSRNRRRRRPPRRRRARAGSRGRRPCSRRARPARPARAGPQASVARWPHHSFAAPVLFRHAHEREHDARREREGQRGHEVERRGRIDGVEQLVHGARIRASIAATRRGVKARDVGRRRRVCAGGSRLTIEGWPVPAGREDLARRGHERDEWELCRRRRVAVRVEEHRLHVGVPGHDVVVERGRVEHRLLRHRQARQHRVGILEEHRVERVEVRPHRELHLLGLRRHRAPLAHARPTTGATGGGGPQPAPRTASAHAPLEPCAPLRMSAAWPWPPPMQSGAARARRRASSRAAA